MGLALAEEALTLGSQGEECIAREERWQIVD